MSASATDGEAYAAVVCESILYGVYLVLFTIAMHLLLCVVAKHKRSR